MGKSGKVKVEGQRLHRTGERWEEVSSSALAWPWQPPRVGDSSSGIARVTWRESSPAATAPRGGRLSPHCPPPSPLTQYSVWLRCSACSSTRCITHRRMTHRRDVRARLGPPGRPPRNRVSTGQQWPGQQSGECSHRTAHCAQHSVLVQSQSCTLYTHRCSAVERSYYAQ